MLPVPRARSAAASPTQRRGRGPPLAEPHTLAWGWYGLLTRRVERCPQPPQNIDERSVCPEMHVVEGRLLTDEVAVQRRRGDAVSSQRVEHRRHVGGENGEVAA